MIAKNIKTITIFTFLFSIVIFLVTLLDFASLHDIAKDYVSQEVLAYLQITTSKILPDWTNTAGEWSIVKVSLFLRVIFLILNTFVLYLFIKKLSLK